jgi:argininosuccinate lyase
VVKGIPFRQAHGLVGKLVACCEKNNKQLRQLELTEFQTVTPAILQDVYEYLGAANVVRRYVTAGAGGPTQAAAQIAEWNKVLAQR